MWCAGEALGSLEASLRRSGLPEETTDGIPDSTSGKSYLRSERKEERGHQSWVCAKAPWQQREGDKNLEAGRPYWNTGSEEAGQGQGYHGGCQKPLGHFPKQQGRLDSGARLLGSKSPLHHLLAVLLNLSVCSCEI